MVTKTKAPARKRVANKPIPEVEKPNLLRAGLQALDKARIDVAQRQSRVFEAILGFEPTQAGATKVAAEALGLRHIVATVAPQNGASQRVLLKAGFALSQLRRNDDGSFTQCFEWRADRSDGH